MPFTGPHVFSTGAGAVDRRTLGEFKAELARPYNPNDETMLAIAHDCVNAAIRKYNRKVWPWEILTADVTFSSDDETEALPQPFKKPLAAYELVASNQDRRLAFIPYESFIEFHGIRSRGQPTSYTLRNVFETGQITVFPIPISGTDVRVHYYRRTPILRKDAEPFEGPPEFEEAILSEARYSIMQRRPGTSGTLLADARVAAAVAERELVQFAAMRGDNIGLA